MGGFWEGLMPFPSLEESRLLEIGKQFILWANSCVLAREVVFVPRSPGKRPALLLVGVKASHIPKAPAKILIHSRAGALLSKEDGAKGIREVGGEEE
ncbi:hypothetical protein DUI87_25592 [Hirundo rustica rustica]|uniref:Uncharacterized protein n=1 Tax=Hirundo rustica rustica TaxID=333673 RepID=A0A3M0JBC3_HIRRU|nr:hypothetical protein DUI87_25592 [Hirundo rustica rustica]